VGAPFSQLQIVDRSGTLTSQIGEPADQFAPAVSPDGTRVIVSVLDPVVGTRDLWMRPIDVVVNWPSLLKR